MLLKSIIYGELVIVVSENKIYFIQHSYSNTIVLLL